MSDIPKPKSITVGVNILLFLYLLYVSFLSGLFDQEVDKHVVMDDFFEIAPVATMAATVVLGVVGILAGALVVRVFWNRLVTSLFSIRDIDYQEALAIILMISILCE